MRNLRSLMSIVLSIVLLSTDILPVFATDASVNNTTVEEDAPVVEETNDGAVTSKLIVTGGEEGVDYTRSNDGVLTVKTSTPLIIDGQGIEITVEQIILGNDASANEINVTLKDVKIISQVAPVKVLDDYSADVNITLVGENVLKGGRYCAGLEKNGGTETGTLTIDGEGSLTATGGEYGDGGAGIGGGNKRAGSNITINGGTVTATGGSDGAGIGGGSRGSGNNITINGGTVTATGVGSGAGIGGGYYETGKNFIIKDASVKATGGMQGSNIGGWYVYHAVTPLYQIEGDPVYLTCIPHYDNLSVKYKIHSSSEWTTLTFPGVHEDDNLFYLYLKEGIYDFVSGEREFNSISVGAMDGYTPKVVNTRKIIMDDILGNTLTIVSENCYKTGNTMYDCSSANDDYYIEQKNSEALNKNIVVKDASKIIVKNLNLAPVYDAAAFLIASRSDMILYSAAESKNIFTSPDRHAGIEEFEMGGILVIEGKGEITAIGGYNGAGIGGGALGSGSNITINGGTVTATGGYYGAGIGGDGSNITINGGTVTATGGSSGAGIGGDYGSGSNITINGGTVTATGGEYGAGIGGGDEADGSNITITGGTVTATGGTWGAGIGGGLEGSGSNITINGGIVIAFAGLNGQGIGCGPRGESTNAYINGGSVKASSIGSIPKKSLSDPVVLQLVIISGYSTGDKAPFTTIPGAEYYNLNNVVALDDGCFYFYLPEGIDLSAYNKYKVQFNTGNGSDVSDQIILSGGKITRPIDPVRYGYKFTRWYKSKNNKSEENKWDFEKDTVTEDITLYAGWELSAGTTPSEPANPSNAPTITPTPLPTATPIPSLAPTDTPTPTPSAAPEDDKVPTAAPVPVSIPEGDGEYGSPMCPAPVLSANTAELYLVKGQKFTLPAGSWLCDDASKKILNISKKGVLTAKKPGNCIITNYDVSINLIISEPVMRSKSFSVEAGGDVRAMLDYDSSKYAVAWFSSNPDIATVSSNGLIHGVSKGSARITAYINGKKYTCKVKVTETTPAIERTLHINVGGTKAIKLKGLSNVSWKSGNKDIADVDTKGKISAFSAGTTVVTASANGKEYKVYVYVENITLKNSSFISKGSNKYEVNMKAGDSIKLEYSKLNQYPEYKSNKAEVAYIEPDGTLKALRAGKAKLTTKINGKSVTITVNVG